MSEWQEVKLADICVEKGVQTGPFGSQLHQKDYVAVGTPIITVEHLGDNRITKQNLPCVSDEDKERLSKYTLQEGDIVFSRVGSVDRRAYVHKEEDGWLFSGRCLRVRVDRDKIDPYYLSAYFGLPSFKEYIRSIAVGATMPSLNTSLLEGVPIILPPEPQQKFISEIAYAIEAKIELNQRMNKTLEGMARAIFKSWFVDFDPVHAKAEGREPEGMDSRTAALFPSAFTPDALPEGWTQETLGRVAESAGVTVQPSQTSPDTPYIGLEHMPRRCIALYEWAGAGKVTSNKFAFVRGDFLFGKLRPYFHKVGIAAIDGISSTDILIVRPKSEEFYAFVLSAISSDEFVGYTDQTSRGTKMPRTNWKDMAAYEIALPDRQVALAYNAVVKPMLEKIIANVHESQTLAALRDTLLPKLISGELRVDATTETLKEAVG